MLRREKIGGETYDEALRRILSERQNGHTDDT